MLSLGILLGLTLSVAPAAPEVKLGEPVKLVVTVKNDGKDAETLPALALDKRSVTFTIGADGPTQFVLQRTLERAPATSSLGGGESWKETLEWTPTRAGSYPIEAAYAGKASATTKVTVAPAGGASEIGVKMETEKGDILIRFFPEVAPNHVAWFAERTRSGFYDNLNFHRVIKQFMLQGGCPQGTGTGGPGYTIPAEFSRDPKYTHSFGRLSTARTSDPNSAGSQFFICFDRAKMLDAKYTVFGETIEGQETLRKIEALGADSDPMPPGFEKVKIRKVTLVPLAK